MRRTEEMRLSPGALIPAHEALNRGCLGAFTMTFIGDGSAFRALVHEGLIHAHSVDATLSLRVLDYYHHVHPQYADIVVPHINESHAFRTELERLSERALAAVEINETATVRIMESKMENSEDSHSALLSTTSAHGHTNAAALMGIANFVRDATDDAPTGADGQPPGADSTSLDATDDARTGTDGRTSGADGTTRDAATVHDAARTGRVQASVDMDLLNTYEDNHLIFGGTFPHAFPLGMPEKFSSGPLPHQLLRRLLLAYTPQFERTPNFIFLAFNQLQLAACSRAVAYEAKSDSKHLAALRELLESEDFDSNLANAISDPDGSDAKRLLIKITPLLRAVGRKVPYSPLERKNELPDLYGMEQRLGPHTEWVTFSQLSSTQPLVIRLGSRMRDGSDHPGLLNDGEVIWSSARISRSATGINSPACCAENFNRVSVAVLTALFGLASLDSKKEKFGADINPGIFGRGTSARACFAVAEAQARGALHLHILLWLVFGPLFFSRFVHEPEGRELIARFIDSKVQVALDATYHARRQQPRSYDEYPRPISNIEEACRVGLGEAAYVQYHEHTPRCRKLPGGAYKCDLAFKQPMSEETTFNQVVLEDVDEDAEEKTLPSNRDVVPLRDIEPPPPLQPPHDQSAPLPDPDNRVIPVTMQRPLAEDRYMAEFNVIQAACLRCNTCNKVVGGAADAKAQVYYTCQYCTKNPVNLQESLPLLQTARALATKYH